MRSSIRLFLLLAPVSAAKAGYIDYEMVESGRTQFAATVSGTNAEGIYDTDTITYDFTKAARELDLQVVGGISRNVNIAVGFSPAGEETIETYSDFHGRSNTVNKEGVGDTSVEFRYRFRSDRRGRSYPLLTIGAILPTGDDKEPIPEITESSGAFQAGEPGGRGTGRTDYTVGFGYYFGAGSPKRFIGVNYTARGERDGIDYGDSLVAFVQEAYPITRSVSFAGSAFVDMPKETEAETGAYDQPEPRIDLEFGGMYSISKDTEIIAAAKALVTGGRTYHYDSTGHRYAMTAFDQDVNFRLILKSRF